MSWLLWPKLVCNMVVHTRLGDMSQGQVPEEPWTFSTCACKVQVGGLVSLDPRPKSCHPKLQTLSNPRAPELL